MITYRKDVPLVFCHIPKMGGTSVRTLFSQVYGENLFNHYNEPIVQSGILVARQPGKLNWQMLSQLAKVEPVCIFGHMRNSEGTGVDDFYPKASQFATFLRHPLEAVVSSYFYTKKIISEGRPIPMPHNSINEWLESVPSQIFNHLPHRAKDNMNEFIDGELVMIATLEDPSGLVRFMRNNFSFVASMPHVNESNYDEEYDPVVAKRWLQRHEEEMKFYRLCVEAKHDRG